MRNLVMASLTVLACAVTAGQASAGGCCIPCCPPVQICWVEKAVTCYRYETHEHEVRVTVARPVSHVEVRQRTCTVMVPEWREEKRTRTVQVCQPREIERTEARTVMVPMQMVDPCTGCCFTVCKPCMETRKVKCTIMVPVPKQEEYTVRVCHYRPEQRTYEEKHVVCEMKAEPVVRKESFKVLVPYQTTVRVPVVVCCK